MPIPDYQTIMYPLLKITEDKKIHTKAEAVDALAKRFSLSEESRRELLPSGRQEKFDNRVGWAATYLRKAKLLESVGRGQFRITDRGLKVLQTTLNGRIDTKLLNQFPEFLEFKNASREEGDAKEGAVDQIDQTQTPEESLEEGYQSLRRGLGQELLERVEAASPKFFEKLVVNLLVTMGYGGSRKDAGQAVGQTGDGGIDGIIKEDRLGLDFVYIQAKRWEGPVGRPVVQGSAGSLEGRRAKRGVLITTSSFTKDAREYVNVIEKRIVLIDGENLAQLMIDYGVGANEVATYIVKKIDLDYFEEDP